MQEKEKIPGTIRISDEVVAICAVNVIQRMKGVSRLHSNIMDNILNTQYSGVKVSRNNDAVIIDVSIIVDFDVQIPQLAWDVQVNVKKEIEQITGLTVSAVNIYVQGVGVPDEEEEND